MTVPTQQTPEQAERARVGTRLLELVAGYLGTWTIELGLRAGLIRSLADTPKGATSRELAAGLALDAEYVDVWCHAAAAAGLVDLTADDRYILTPHLATLLLDADASEYLGGLVRTCVGLRETFVDLRRSVRSGQRKGPSGLSTESIAAVNDMSVPFYQRLAADVIPHLPSVERDVRSGGRVLDLTCGTCAGLIRLALAFPEATFTAVDADWYSIEQARPIVREHGVMDRFQLLHSAPASSAIVNPGTPRQGLSAPALPSIKSVSAPSSVPPDAPRPSGYSALQWTEDASP